LTLACAATVVLLAANESLAQRPDSIAASVIDEGASCTVGDPISAGSGAYFFTMPLLNLGGPMPLTYELRYNAGFAYNERRLERQFEDNIDRYLMAEGPIEQQGWPAEAHALLRNGIRAGFTNSLVTGEWHVDPITPIPYGLQAVETNQYRRWNWYYLSDPLNERVYAFEDAQRGMLAYLSDRNGNRHSYTIEEANSKRYVASVSDGLGRSLTFNYDPSDWTLPLTNVVDQAGRTIEIIREDRFVIRHVVDAGGGTTTFHYAGRRRIGSVEHPCGNRPYTQTYARVTLAGGDEWRVTSQTDAYSNTTELAYDAASNRVTETRADGTQVVYDHFHEKSPPRGINDAGGNQAAFTQTANTRPESVTDRMGDTTSIVYHEASGKIASYRDAEGNLYSNTYTAVDQVFTNAAAGHVFTNTFYDLTRRDYPDGTVEMYGTDGRGNVTARVDRTGHTWRYTYNSRGQVLTVTNPEGGVTTYTYNPDATLASRTDSDTGVTTYTYDAYKRLSGIQRPDGTAVGFGYDLNDRLTSYTDANGEVTTYTYDANGNLLEMTDPLAHARSYTYDLMDRLTNVADSIGPVANYGYDNLERPVSMIDAGGLGTVLSYDPRGWVTNVIRDGENRVTACDLEGVPTARATPLGHNTTYRTDRLGMVTGIVDSLSNTYAIERDAMGRVVSTENPLGHMRTYIYDGLGRLASMTAPVVGTASFARDGLGRAVGYTNFNGEAWTYGYTPMGRLAAVTNPLGHATEYAYDTVGRLERTDFADGAHTEIAYDANGRVRSRRDRGGFVRSYGYDEAGRIVSATNPAGGIVNYTHNPDGTPATRTDTDLGVYSNRYDALRRLTEGIAPDGATTRYAYDAFNRVTNTVDANGGSRSYAYDADGRLVRATDPLAHARGYAYDALNRLTNVTDRLGHATRYEYDAVGRPIGRTDAEGVAVEYVYDAANRRTGTTLDGQTWQYGYDDQSRLTSRTTPLGRTMTLTRDAAGSVVEVTDPMGHTATLMRDEMRRVTQVVDPVGKTNAYSYNARGLLAGVSNAISGASYAYNDLGLLDTLTDPNGEDWTFGYTDMGRPVMTADPLSRTNAYAYDPRGRLAGVTFADGKELAIARDSVGNVTNLTYSDGTRIEYEYDALNRLVHTTGTTAAVSFTYDTEGRVTGADNPGSVFGAGYGSAGRLYEATYNNGAVRVSYTYYPNGLLRSVTDSLTGTTITFIYDADRRLVGILRPNGVNTTYTWDAASRLTRIQAGSVLDLGYELDAADQVTKARVKAPLTAASLLVSSAQAHTFDAAAQINSRGYAYDERGRLRGTLANGFVWNAAGHLLMVFLERPFELTRMTYNGLGLPVTSSQSGGPSRHFYYNYAVGGARIMAEGDDASGQMVRFYVYTPRGRLLYMIDALNGNNVHHYHFDRQGSTLALTGPNGVVTDAYVYTGSGLLLRHNGTSLQPFMFGGMTGVRLQEVPGMTLYCLSGRYYNPETGRFLSPTPPTAPSTDPDTSNPYQYAVQKPSSCIDPRGGAPEGDVRVGGDDWEEVPRQCWTDEHWEAYGEAALGATLLAWREAVEAGRTKKDYEAWMEEQQTSDPAGFDTSPAERSDQCPEAAVAQSLAAPHGGAGATVMVDPRDVTPAVHTRSNRMTPGKTPGVRVADVAGIHELFAHYVPSGDGRPTTIASDTRASMTATPAGLSVQLGPVQDDTLVALYCGARTARVLREIFGGHAGVQPTPVATPTDDEIPGVPTWDEFRVAAAGGAAVAKAGSDVIWWLDYGLYLTRALTEKRELSEEEVLEGYRLTAEAYSRLDEAYRVATTDAERVRLLSEMNALQLSIPGGPSSGGDDPYDEYGEW